jgi:hypothetical protein
MSERKWEDEQPVRLSHMWKQTGNIVVIFSDARFNLSRMELNAVGSRVWLLIDGKRTVRDIIAILQREFPLEEKNCIAKGVKSFLNELREEWLVMNQEELKTYE